MADALAGWVTRRCARTPVVADVALMLGVLALSLAAPGAADHHPVGGVAVALTILGDIPLVARRLRPITALAVTAGAEALYLALTPLPSPGSGLALAVVLYTVASRGDRRATVRLAGLVAGINAAILLAGLALGRANTLPVLIAVLALVVGGWSLGDNVRTRRAYLAQLEDRARRLEAERDEEAHRAVRQERARIARELHDVVAHHVSAIAVQAGVAATIAEREPGRAHEALTFIQETSRQALAEMRTLFTVLRSDGETGAERAPQPSLAQVAHLVNQSRAAA